MTCDRFEMVQEISSTWAIFDNVTGTPAEHDGRVMIGLQKAEAEAMLRAGIVPCVFPVPSAAPEPRKK